VGLDHLTEAQWIEHFARFEPLPGSFDQPLALRYHGHQFRVYNPDLGDGRGFLFAQLRDDQQRLLDLGTKGSGQTPYSRTADGRLTLKGGMREVLASAMLEAQGVYTSKAFSLIETGENLIRPDEPSPTRSSVLVRLSHSHIRFGTFQRLLAENDAARIEQLIAYCNTHYHRPGDREATDGIGFFRNVVRRVAALAAQWMAAGFVHGVLNTDNMTITGESFDYGPYRWLPTFDPAFTAAYFDHMGLYAYGRQPGTAKWNLARLAECLTLLVPVAALEEALEEFGTLFETSMRDTVCWRLGLKTADGTTDEALVGAIFSFLAESQAPFEQVFFSCAGGEQRLDAAADGPLKDFAPLLSFDRLREAFKGRALREGLLLDSEYFQRREPETMLHNTIEAVWAPIAENDDWAALEAKLARIDEMRRAYAA
jgi:serine/tyrosine/threonine adenylyltransferase